MGDADPPSISASQLDLPKAWPDYTFRSLFRFLRSLAIGGRPVELPARLPGGTELPAYLLREFHRMPNGYYSHRLASGYERGFERAMLGCVAPMRRWIAEQLADCRSALDLGCGSGKVGGALLDAGVSDVWGIDPSPYQLKVAHRAFPSLQLVQGIAENTPFSAGRFDGVAACFLFHELPISAQDAVLAETRRVLRGGGRIVICEPSPDQAHHGVFALWKRYGWKGVYFRLLAGFVTEPYLEEWHGRDVPRWAADHGFSVEADVSLLPFRRIVLRRR